MNRRKKNTLPDRYCYPALFTATEEGVSVAFPDLDCTLTAKDEPSALRAAQMKLGRTLFQMEQTGVEIPASTSLFDVEAEEGTKTCMIDVYMPAIRMAENSRAVNRMVTLPAWLNAAAMERNINFSHVLQEALKKEIFHDFAD